MYSAIQDGTYVGKDMLQRGIHRVLATADHKVTIKAGGY